MNSVQLQVFRLEREHYIRDVVLYGDSLKYDAAVDPTEVVRDTERLYSFPVLRRT